MRKSPSIFVYWLSFAFLAFGLLGYGQAQTSDSAALPVKDGQKVVFFGDEATEQGGKIAGGFVKLVFSGFETLGMKIVPVVANGGASREMLAHLDHDVLQAKPDWVVLSSGFAEAWGHSADIETYKKNVNSMVDQLQAAGIRVMILTPLPVEPIDNEFNSRVAATVDFLRQLAKEKNITLADVNAACLAYLKAQPLTSRPDILTIRANYPNPEGHKVIAQTILQAWGVSHDQLSKVEAIWLDAPGNATVTANCNFAVRHTTLNLKQYADLKKVALSRKMPLFELIDGVYLESILEALKAHGDFSTAHPDNISNEADPIFKQKILDLIKS